jgi:hypothetical protein
VSPARGCTDAHETMNPRHIKGLHAPTWVDVTEEPDDCTCRSGHLFVAELLVARQVLYDTRRVGAAIHHLKFKMHCIAVDFASGPTSPYVPEGRKVASAQVKPGPALAPAPHNSPLLTLHPLQPPSVIGLPAAAQGPSAGGT